MARVWSLAVAAALCCLSSAGAQTAVQVHPVAVPNIDFHPVQNPVRIQVPRVNVHPVVPSHLIGRDYVYQYPNGYVPYNPLIGIQPAPSVPAAQPQRVSPDPGPVDHLNGVLLSRIPRAQANQLNFPAQSDVRYSNRLVAGVQQDLRRLGYYSGMVDGNLGPETGSAIQRYQVDHRLPVTGLLDREMLSQLGIVTH